MRLSLVVALITAIGSTSVSGAACGAPQCDKTNEDNHYLCGVCAA